MPDTMTRGAGSGNAEIGPDEHTTAQQAARPRGPVAMTPQESARQAQLAARFREENPRVNPSFLSGARYYEGVSWQRAIDSQLAAHGKPELSADAKRALVAVLARANDADARLGAPQVIAMPRWEVLQGYVEQLKESPAQREPSMPADAQRALRADRAGESPTPTAASWYTVGPLDSMRTVVLQAYGSLLDPSKVRPPLSPTQAAALEGDIQLAVAMFNNVASLDGLAGERLFLPSPEHLQLALTKMSAPEVRAQLAQTGLGREVAASAQHTGRDARSLALKTEGSTNQREGQLALLTTAGAALGQLARGDTEHHTRLTPTNADANDASRLFAGLRRDAIYAVATYETQRFAATSAPAGGRERVEASDVGPAPSRMAEARTARARREEHMRTASNERLHRAENNAVAEQDGRAARDKARNTGDLAARIAIAKEEKKENGDG